MLISFFRTIILYLLIVFAFRIMGKRQVEQLKPTELVVALMISDLASIPMGHVSIPLVHGIIPILTLVFAEAILSFFDLKSRKFRKFISGSPAILIKDGIVLENELRRLRMSTDDLMEELRINGSTNIKDIKYAIFETNGNLSVILKSNSDNAKDELGQNQKYKGLPFMLICDGVVNQSALNIYNKDLKWLNKQLEKNDTKHIKDVLFAGVTDSGEFYLQKRRKR